MFILFLPYWNKRFCEEHVKHLFITKKVIITFKEGSIYTMVLVV